MYIFGMISGNKMERITEEVLADFALDEGLDCWDLAVIFLFIISFTKLNWK